MKIPTIHPLNLSFENICSAAGSVVVAAALSYKTYEGVQELYEHVRCSFFYDKVGIINVNENGQRSNRLFKVANCNNNFEQTVIGVLSTALSYTITKLFFMAIFGTAPLWITQLAIGLSVAFPILGTLGNLLTLSDRPHTTLIIPINDNELDSLNITQNQDSEKSYRGNEEVEKLTTLRNLHLLSGFAFPSCTESKDVSTDNEYISLA